MQIDFLLPLKKKNKKPPKNGNIQQWTFILTWQQLAGTERPLFPFFCGRGPPPFSSPVPWTSEHCSQPTVPCLALQVFGGSL